MQISIIKWIPVKSDAKLPKLDKEVLFVRKTGEVTWGSRSIRRITEKNKNTGFFELTDKTQIEWGQSENGGEFWCEFTDIIFWAEFPIFKINNNEKKQ